MPESKYTTRVLKWAVIRESEGWMSDYATMIEVEDEGAGEFLVISQPFAGKREDGGISITAEEWPAIRASIEAAFQTLTGTETACALTKPQISCRVNETSPPTEETACGL